MAFVCSTSATSYRIYPNFLLVIIVCFSYAVIAPVLMAAGVLYFALALVVYKHQFLLVYLPKYETGGALWPTLVDFTLTGLQVANLTLIGYTALKTTALASSQSQHATHNDTNDGTFSIALALLLLLVAVEAYRAFAKRAYLKPSLVLSREAAVRIDRALRAKQLPSALTESKGVPADEPDLMFHDADEAAAAQPLWSSFDPHLYRQPALDMAPLVPAQPKPPKPAVRRRRLREKKDQPFLKEEPVPSAAGSFTVGESSDEEQGNCSSPPIPPLENTASSRAPLISFDRAHGRAEYSSVRDGGT